MPVPSRPWTRSSGFAIIAARFEFTLQPKHPELRKIPVVVLTTSKAEEDVVKTYDLGVNPFITKPVTFAALVEVMQTWSRYWFEIVDLPGGRG